MRDFTKFGVAAFYLGFFGSTAWGADSSGYLGLGSNIPEAGKSGVFHGPAVDLGSFSKNFDGRLAGQALSRLQQGDMVATRGATEAALYQKVAPAVVLIVTNDALGSGSFISNDGLIITNWHVVSGASTVGVIIKPAKEGDTPSKSDVLTADVIRYDQIADLALLKLHTKPAVAITSVALGNFDSVKVGDDVNAIGHPVGEAWTYTKGYVSQVRRAYEWKTEEGITHKADVIQTQTPINPGNSGGPLFNNTGALIGINAFKSDGEGLNFAIGVDAVQAFMKSAQNRLASTTSSSASECKPRVIFDGRTKDNTGALRQIDAECHGKVDYAIVLPDDTSQPMYVVVDTKETGKPDGMILSLKRDGHWDISYWDTHGTGHFDVIGRHPDGAIVPSSFEPYTEK